MSKFTRISSAEIARAKEAAAEAGLCLSAIEKRPDGTVKLEFGEAERQNNARWFADSPLYRDVA